MAVYTRRVQAVLTEEHYNALSRLAHETGRSLSLLIRDALEQVYFEQAQRERRRAALERLLSLNAPVAEWDQMESEIVQGATACRP